MEASNLNNCYSEEFSEAKMQAIEINEFFRKSLSGINHNGDILDQVKRLKRAKGNKIWLTNEVLKSIDVLSFAIFTDKCILANWDKIKPRNVADAHLKLYAYVRYNAHIKLAIIDNFDRCRAELGFQYYDLVEISGCKYNPSQTFIYEQITMMDDEQWRDKTGDDKEAIEALKRLICMVDLSQIDSSNNNTFYYVYRCKKSNELLNRMPNVIQRIQHGCQRLNQMSGLVNTSVSFDNSYLFELIILPEYLKLLDLANITENFDIQVDPNGLIIDILRKYDQQF